MKGRHLILVVLSALIAIVVFPLGSSTQPSEIGLIPAKLTVQWMSERRKITEGESVTHSYRSYKAEEEEKETLDATINLEVPDTNYWKKPENIHVFAYVMGKAIGPEHLEVPRGKRVKLPKTKLISYDGAIYYKFRSHYWLGPIMAPDCEETEYREGSGQLTLGPPPGGSFQLQFMGEDKGLVHITSGPMSITGESKSTCDSPPSSRRIPPQQHALGAAFPMILPTGGVLPGWSAKVERIPSGLRGTATFQGKEGGADVRKAMTWSLALNPGEIEAVPGGPYEAVRGQPLTLDGSRSKGKNLKYEWAFTLEKCPEGVAANRGARKEGVRPTVVPLCDTHVTLKVTDGKNTDTKTVPVVVTARDWKTRVYQQIDAYLQVVGLCRPETQFGRNVCALDGAAAFEGEQKSGHFIHKTPDHVGWENTGYVLGRVSDRNGPFDGWWYVKENLLRIQRAALINRDLNKQSALYEENRKRGHQRDFDTLIDQVEAHERLHGTLIEEALPKYDPAKMIEEMLHRSDKDALRLKIDLAIQKADESLLKATSDENVKERLSRMKKFNRSGKVLLKVCNTERFEVFTIGSFALIGD